MVSEGFDKTGVPVDDGQGCEEAPAVCPGEEGPENQGPQGAEKPDELAKLREALATEQGRSQEHLDHLRRLQAEFENYRRRMMKEQSQWREAAVAEFAGRILPVMDNLDRALAAVPPDPDNALRQGVEMTRRLLMEALTETGVTAIEAEGRPFNPDLHQAMLQVETTEHPDNTIIEEFQRGYLLKSRVIRPSMVKVAANPEDTGTAGEHGSDEEGEVDE